MLKTWDGIKQVTNTDKKSTQKVYCITDENVYIHHAKQIAEMFDNHILQLGQKMHKKHQINQKKV